MDIVFLNRLITFANIIKAHKENITNLCSHSWNHDKLGEAKILASKLQSVLNRFNADLYQYFNMTTNPDADEISRLTTIQLEGEEALAELNTRVQLNEAGPSHVNINRTKLPELNLPSFKGDVMNWFQFWDQFSSNIDQRNLRDVDKLLYLKTSLKGEAKTIIEGLESTNDNYQIAVSILKERYGRKTQIIDAHYSALYKLKRADQMEDCRQTLDEMEKHLRILESLGENTNQNHLRFLILEKFPQEIIYELRMKQNTESILDMRKQLHTIITARQDAKQTFSLNGSSEASCTTEALHVSQIKRRGTFKYPNTKKVSNKYQRTQPSTSFLNKTFTPRKRNYEPVNEAQRPKNNKKMKISCIFCDEEHFNDQCTKLKTVQERKQKLKDRCYICLMAGHRAGTCRRKPTCVHCGDIGKHHRALCPKKFGKIPTQSTNTLHVHGKESILLQTAIVNVMRQDGVSKKCRLLCDSGSQRSYVTKGVVKDLNLPIEEENHLFVFTFGASKPQELDSPLVKLNIRTRTGKTKTIFANVVPSITQGIAHPCFEILNDNDNKQYILADDGSLQDRVDILIGNDYYYSIMLPEKVQIMNNLYLVNSEFGWIYSGIVETNSEQDLSVLTYFQSSCKNELTEPDPPLDGGNLKVLWDLESIGITDSPKIDRDEEAVNNFNETTVLKDNRYHVSWPWNQYPPDLQSNFGLAYGRLVNLLKRLDSATLLGYKQTLEDQLNKGVIEVVPKESKVDHPIHYLPHHGVKAPGKTLRIVYDASAKTKNTKSLNECLYCGPLMLEDLTRMLIKFRCHTIGITADIEKAFLQIGLNNKDRDVTRFLWLKDINKPATEENLLQYRFTRVPFGIISSPFLLNATVRHHLLGSNCETIRNLANDIYVDNLLTGTSNTEEAVTLYKDSKEVFQQISMNLRAWISNSKELMQHITDTLDTGNDKIVKTLGLNWNYDQDTLSLRPTHGNHAFSKRGVLKTIAAIYDPCGFSVPTVLPAKLLLQDLWKAKVKWDTPLHEEMKLKWKCILENLKRIETIYLPRNMCVSPEEGCQLHCFTDSSTLAYAAVLYMVQGGKVNFVIGKSRLVPIKDLENLKIPRLELLGVLIGSRLMRYVANFIPLNVTCQVLWTDSQIVIDWCHSNKLLAPFVSRRIEEIKRNKNLIIRHVPSGFNPADTATRPTSSVEDQRRWLAGPDFLTQDPSTWPTGVTTVILAGEVLANEEQSKNIEEEEPIINMDVESNPEEAKETSNPEEKMEELEDTTIGSPILRSEVQEIKELQLQFFPEEVKGKRTHLVRNLGLFTDVDGMLRCDGRLKHSDLSYDAKHPILLPRDCNFTCNLIKRVHENNLHVGVPHTLSILRQNYWIPQGRSQVQRVINKCPQCIKHGGGPYALPQTPALPPERVQFTSSYNFTGVDFFGPVFVKTQTGREKRWICLFCCLVIRGINLEIVKDMSTEECLLAFQRFIATRGTPKLIVSDNAPQFRLLSEILTYLKEEKKEKIQWKFIPQLAPWHGGAYERLVAIVKHCLKRSLQKHLIDDNQLLTIIKQVESVVNTRPLTYVGADLDYILKPADFLTPGKCFSTEIFLNEDSQPSTSTKQQLIEGWKRGQIIMNEYKEMFTNQYLLSLRERYKHSPKHTRITSCEPPRIGDVVQIKGESKNRINWKVGKIVELLKGADNQCRVAKVKVGNTTFTRSIAHLYPLEVEETESQQSHSRKNPEYVENTDMDITPGTSRAPVTEPEDLPDTDLTTTDEIDRAMERVDMPPDVISDRETEDNTDTNREQDDMMISESIDDVDMTSETIIEPPQQRNPRRAAAVRALERIREWTQNLLARLL